MGTARWRALAECSARELFLARACPARCVQSFGLLSLGAFVFRNLPRSFLALYLEESFALQWI
jgi:hypothetical protein